MLVPCKNYTGFREYIISFTAFSVEKSVTLIDWLEK